MNSTAKQRKIKTIKRLRLCHWSWKDIGVHYGCSASTVWRWAKQHNIDTGRVEI